MNKIACKKSKKKFIFNFTNYIFNNFLLYVKSNNISRNK